jgi:hypothetical protein
VQQRRYPRYGRFIGTGAAAGLLVAFVVAVVNGGGETYSRWTVFGYVGLLCGTIGALVGGGVAVLLDGSRKGGS